MLIEGKARLHWAEGSAAGRSEGATAAVERAVEGAMDGATTIGVGGAVQLEANFSAAAPPLSSWCDCKPWVAKLSAAGVGAVSYTHLTLPTTPYV